MEYKTLQWALGVAKERGWTSINLNSSKDELQKEHDRLRVWYWEALKTGEVK